MGSMNEAPDFWEWLAGQNLPRASAEADLAHAAWVAAAEWARREALREALAAINEVRVTDSGPLGDGYELGLECAADILRELAD